MEIPSTSAGQFPVNSMQGLQCFRMQVETQITECFSVPKNPIHGRQKDSSLAFSNIPVSHV